MMTEKCENSKAKQGRAGPPLAFGLLRDPQSPRQFYGWENYFGSLLGGAWGMLPARDNDPISIYGLSGLWFSGTFL